MKIMAIDPGPIQSAFVMWDTLADDFIDCSNFGCMKKMGIQKNCLLEEIITAKLSDDVIDISAIEMVQSYGLSVGRSTFETTLQVGRFTRVFSEKLISFRLYGRPTIKGQIGGKTDAQVRASLRMRYGEAKKGEKLEGVKKDIWSALALATALTENPNLKEW